MLAKAEIETQTYENLGDKVGLGWLGWKSLAQYESNSKKPTEIGSISLKTNK
jgi:hypothetical protein